MTIFLLRSYSVSAFNASVNRGWVRVRVGGVVVIEWTEEEALKDCGRGWYWCGCGV
jgi:hypothetical protein